jgi:transposase
MNVSKEILGVDINKDVFDVHGSTKGHNQYKNNETRFKKFLKKLPDDCLVAMETTDYDQYRLAQFLYKDEVVLSLVKEDTNKGSHCLLAYLA